MPRGNRGGFRRDPGSGALVHQPTRYPVDQRVGSGGGGGGGGGGGTGTVTSITGGTGIANTPDPIITTGVIDLDIFDLATESSLAAGDWFPFLDISAGTDPADQRRVTLTNLAAGIAPLIDLADLGTRSHADLQDLVAPADDHTQYFHLPGRVGGQAAFGSPNAGDDLTFRSNPADDGVIFFGAGALVLNEGTGQIGSFLPWFAVEQIYAQDYIAGNVASGSNLTLRSNDSNDGLISVGAGTTAILVGEGTGVCALSATTSVVLNSLGDIVLDATTLVSVPGAELHINGLAYTWPSIAAVGVLTNDGANNLTWVAAAGTGTVTSVAGGVGITNTPDPIIAAGTVDLDINSLTSESTVSTGDLFAFVDVSVGTAPADQRKATIGNLVTGIEPLLDLGNLGGLIDWTTQIDFTGSDIVDIASRDHDDLQNVTANQHHAQSHVVATTAGLGPDHTTSGLTAGQVLRATGATTAAFQVLDFSDLAGSASDAQIPNTITIDNLTQVTTRSHSALQNLVAPADDHTQYFHLPGRAGGQSAKGGTAVADNLSLDASAAANYTGHIRIGANAGDYGNTTAFGLSLWPNDITIGLGSINAISWQDDVTVTASSTGRVIRGFALDSIIRGGFDIGELIAVLGAFTYINTTASAATVNALVGFQNNPAVFATAAGNSSVVRIAGLDLTLTLDGSGGGTVPVTLYQGMAIADPDISGGSITTWTGLDVEAITATTTLSASVRSAMTVSALTRWHLYLSGTAPSLFGGPLYGGLTDAATLDLYAYTPAWTAAGTGRIQLHNQVTFPENWTLTNAVDEAIIEMAATYTFPVGSNKLMGYWYHPTITYSTVQTISQSSGVRSGPIIQPTATVTDSLGVWAGIEAQPNYTPTAAGCITPLLMGVWSRPRSFPSVAATLTEVAAYATWADDIFTSHFNSNVTITRLAHYICRDPRTTASGNPTISEHVGLYIPGWGVGTTKLSIRSTHADNEMRHAGSAVFGADAARTNASVALEVQSTTQALLLSRMTRAQRNTLAGVAVADGMVLYENNAGLVTTTARNGGLWVELPGWDVCVSKLADQTVTNSTTLTDDTDLQFTVVAGEAWYFELILAMTGSNTTGDGKFQLLATVATFTNSWRSGVHFDGAGALVTGLFTPAAFTSTTEMVTAGGLTVLNGDTNLFPIYFKGFFRASANATVKVQFANAAAASGRTTIMQQGSILRAKRMI